MDKGSCSWPLFGSLFSALQLLQGFSAEHPPLQLWEATLPAVDDLHEACSQDSPEVSQMNGHAKGTRTEREAYGLSMSSRSTLRV